MRVFVSGKLFEKAGGAGQRAGGGGRLPADGVHGAVLGTWAHAAPQLSLARLGVAGSSRVPEPPWSWKKAGGRGHGGQLDIGVDWGGRRRAEARSKAVKLRAEPHAGRGKGRGRKGRGGGEKGRAGAEGESWLAAPEQPLCAAVAAAAAAGPDSPGAQGSARLRTARAPRLGRRPLSPPAPLLAPARTVPGARSHHAAAVPELDAGCAHAAGGLPHLRRHLGDRRRNRVNSCAPPGRAGPVPSPGGISPSRTLHTHTHPKPLCVRRAPLSLSWRGGWRFWPAWPHLGPGTVW